MGVSFGFWLKGEVRVLGVKVGEEGFGFLEFWEGKWGCLVEGGEFILLVCVEVYLRMGF